MGTPNPVGVGTTLITPPSIFYEPQENRIQPDIPVKMLLVVVETDEGINGIGTIGYAWGGQEHIIENHLKCLLLNQNPFD